jgi:DNA-binding MarR family transcriptional regulator
MATRARSVRVTERDRRLLAFIADHRLVLAAHAGALLGVSEEAASARLRALSKAGMLSRQRLLHEQPAHYQITRTGLALIASSLPRPRVDLRCYDHDIGTAWLWLAARSGALGALREVLSERQLRSRDGTADGRREPLGVRLGGVGPSGRERLHYPDLLLTTATGHRVAVELELSSKGRSRREKILAGYGADPRIDAVVYFVEERNPQLARAIRASAARLGISRLVHVQRVRPGGAAQAGAVAATERAQARSAGADGPVAGSRVRPHRPAGSEASR